MKIFLVSLLLFSFCCACNTTSKNETPYGLIALDDGKKTIDYTDIRVHQANELLVQISNTTKEKPNDVAANINTCASTIRKKYGKDVKRLMLLEELKIYYDNSKSKQSTKDALSLIATQYADKS